jgi:hypothetical protein
MHALHDSQEAPLDSTGDFGVQSKAKIMAYGDSSDTAVVTVEQEGTSGRFGLTPLGFVSQTPIKSLVIELVNVDFDTRDLEALGLGSIFFDTSE